MPGVLAALPPQVQVIVVDNGSRDRTAEVARARGATVLSCATRGYGSAVSAGLTYLSTQPPQIVAILDADHADRPELLHRLLVPIREGRADLVLADRTRTADVGSLTLVQRLGNTFAVALMRQTRGVQHRDMGPFRALRWSIVPALGMVDPTWGWNVEMALKTHNRGFRSLEVPMPYRRRKLGQSKISGTLSGAARAGARILIAVARYHRA